MYAPPGVKTNHNEFPIPDRMRAWVLGDPGELSVVEKTVPVPKKAEVLVRIDAVAICATDLDVIHHGPPAMIEGGLPFNKNFTPGHEYMGTVVALGPGVDEYKIGTRVSVEIHAGCGQCKRCREGMYTSCHNYGLNYGDVDKGHRANGFTTDGGFCEYQVNNINTLVPIADDMSDEEGTLVVTAGTAMYALTELGGLVAGGVLYVIASGAAGFDPSAGFASNGYGEHSPHGYSLQAALVCEVVMTFMFLIVVLGSTSEKAPVGFAPLAIGLALTLIHLISIPVTNTSVNPARSTAVALYQGSWAISQLWAFWLAPLVGAGLAGIVHRWLGFNETGRLAPKM